MKKYAILLLILTILSLSLFGCGLPNNLTKQNSTLSLDCADEIVMEVGDTRQLTYTANNLNGAATWQSNDTSVADVNSAGLVTAKKKGVALISVTIDNKADAVIITVNEKKQQEEDIQVEISASRTAMFIGQSVTLSATVTPQKYQSSVTYHIENSTGIASIDGNILYAVKEGTVSVYAKVQNVTSDCIEITISEEQIKADSITLSSNKTQMKVGESATLSATVSPSKYSQYVEYVITSGSENANLKENVVNATSTGTVKVIAKIGDVKSNEISITIEEATIVADSVTLRAKNYYITVGESTTLYASVTPSAQASFVKYNVSDTSVATISGTTLKTLKTGDVTVTASVGGTVSEPITIHVVASGGTPTSISLSTNKTNVSVGQYATLSYSVYPTSSAKDIEYFAIEGEDNVEIVGEKVYVLSKSPTKIVGRISGVIATTVIEINPNTMTSDPYSSYTSASKRNTFHSSGYTEATCLQDAQYRSEHYLMSGELTVPDQAPTIASNQPKYNGKYYRNSATLYLDNGSTYIVFDANGDIADIIYKGGAYITLEEVAAYVLAFGDVPANYDSNKSSTPSGSDWTKYLRVNHSYFSGNTSSYPYEPVLPKINGVSSSNGGGSYSYYELDIGTTGTDCDPSYTAKLYNNGSSITRGAARIVYSRYTSYSSSSGGTEFTDINDRYVFYTYNHYNDFQEYLNYENGWGEKFGNVTGGGTLSSKTDYNPTSYVQVLTLNFLANRLS